MSQLLIRVVQLAQCSMLLSSLIYLLLQVRLMMHHLKRHLIYLRMHYVTGLIFISKTWSKFADETILNGTRKVVRLFEYEELKRDEKEDYLELAILKYLQIIQKPVERKQIVEYLRIHDIFVPQSEFKLNNAGTELKIGPRFSFALTSLSHANLIYHPKHGLTALTKLGSEVNTSQTSYIHHLVRQRWIKYHREHTISDDSQCKKLVK